MRSKDPTKTPAIMNLGQWWRTRAKALMGASRRLKIVMLAVLVVVVVAGGLLARFVFFSPYIAMQNHPIGAGTIVSGSAVPQNIKAVATTASNIPFTATQPISSIVQITPSGELPAPITLRFKLNRQLTTNDVALAVTSEAPSGPWTLLQPTISSDGWYASVQTTHLSLFGISWFDVTAAAGEFTKQLLAAASGDLLAEAEQPKCQNEAKARYNSYYITSSAKDTLYWCFGVEDNVRVLKIVNRMRYTLEVAHPGFTVKNEPKPTIEFDQLARIGSGQTTILYPFEEVDYTVNLAAGKEAQISTAYSGYAESLNQLSFGVTALINILVWAKAEAVGLRDQPLTMDEWVRTARVMKAFLDVKDCLNAITSLNTGKFFVDCFNWNALKKVFGWKGLLLAPITFIGSVGAYFLREFNALGDQLNGRSKYQVFVGQLKAYQGIVYRLPNSSPGDITAGSDGNLWFIDGTTRIGRITLDGDVKEFHLPDPGSNFYPAGITAGSDGSLWFVNAEYQDPSGPPGSGSIGRITTSGKVTMFTVPGGDPTSITAGRDGNMWFTDKSGSIGYITPDGHITKFPVNAGLNGGIAAGSDGNIWFAAVAGVVPQVGRITPSGKVTLFRVPSDGYSDTCVDITSCGFTAGPDGNLWLADQVDGTLVRITTQGAMTKFRSALDSPPAYVTAGSDGNLWFTAILDGLTGTAIGRMTPSGHVSFPVPYPKGSVMSGITSGPDGDLWLTGGNDSGGLIWRVAP